jgi:hypothetical protein
MKYAKAASPVRRGSRGGNGLMLAAVGLVLWQAWTGYRELGRRRANAARPAAKPPALERWEGEGGQPLRDPPAS